jgi:hypothetical protein
MSTPSEEDLPELYPVADKRERKRARRARARRLGLNRVNLGLAFHYAVVLAVFAGLWAGVLAIMFRLAAWYTGEDEALATMTVFFCVSSVCLLLAGLVQTVTFVLCLAVPNGLARGLLIGSQACWAVVLPLAGWVLWPTDFRVPALGGALFFLFASWALWVLFLRGTAEAIKQPELAESCVHILWRGLWTTLLVVVLLTLATLYVMLLDVVQYQFLRFFVVGVTVMTLIGLSRIAAATGFFESAVHFLLFPTGVLPILKYLDLIGSMRMVILRRS